MAVFSETISYKYQDLDYNGVFRIYKWIMVTMYSLFEHIEYVNSYVDFEMGDLSHSFFPIEEFKSYAYGQHIKVKGMSFHFYQEEDGGNMSTIADILFVDNQFEAFIVRCENKENHITICTALKNSLKPKKPEPIVVQQVTNIHNDESVHVTVGDNNIIQDMNIGKDNIIKKDVVAPKKSWWEPVTQNLAARVIWGIGALIVALLGYYGINYTNFMK